MADSRKGSGDAAGAVDALQRAAAWHAGQIDAEDHNDTEYADVCSRLAELLVTLDRLPEAIQSYQEAVDACVRAGDDVNSGRFAREILALTRQLWQRPEDRLYLLIARMEREIRQLEESEGTQRARADFRVRIGTILQRRDRFADLGEALRAGNCAIRKVGRIGAGAGWTHHQTRRPLPLRAEEPQPG